MIIKIIARGFIMHKHAYLSDVLNWLDFVVVISGTISVLSDLMDLPKNSVSQVAPILFASLDCLFVDFLFLWHLSPF